MLHRPCVFGEVLFDRFPDGREVLGGAPFNVCWHLQAFGLKPLMVSRVGDDSAGERVREAMRGCAMDTGGLQTDPRLPTGQVTVTLDHGEPSYDIVHPAAWDAIEAPESAHPKGLLYHGSLALRDERSRRGLKHLRRISDGLVFLDVNLRDPWWRRDSVLEWVEAATWVKLNIDELGRLGEGGPWRDSAEQFLDEHALQGLVVTLGADGALVLTAGGECVEAAARRTVEVQDTVGAGDAFSAVTLLGLEHGWRLETTLHRALDFAECICGQRGAIPQDAAFYRRFVADWGMAEEGAGNV